MDEAVAVIIGVDGGQTKTACLVGKPDGTLLSYGVGGTAALMNAPDPRKLMNTALDEAVGGALHKLGKRPEKALAAYLGLTGGVGWALEIMPQIIPCEYIRAESDTLAALASGVHSGPGVVLLCGTGAVALAQTASGEQIIHGGYGYLLGDEGSGYWFGRQVIIGTIHNAEGRSPASSVFSKAMKRLGAACPRELAAGIYEDRIQHRDVAALAPLVFAAYREGDPFAVELVERAAAELAGLAISVCRSVELKDPEEKRLVFAGGMLHWGSPVASRCAAILERELPGFELIYPRLSPVAGAFILALRLANIETSPEVLENIYKSYPQVLNA